MSEHRLYPPPNLGDRLEFGVVEVNAKKPRRLITRDVGGASRLMIKTNIHPPDRCDFAARGGSLTAADYGTHRG